MTVSGGTGTTTLVFQDGTERYEVQMDSDGRVDVIRGGESINCKPSGAPTAYTVNVSASTVNGKHCSALELSPTLDDSYEVSFENTGATGTYSITANTGVGPEQVIYAVDIDVTHRTTTADYEGTIRVAPEEI